MNCKIKSRRETGTFSALENPAWAGASSCQPLWAALGQHGEGSPTHPAALAQQLGTAAYWSLLLGGREMADMDLL